MRLDPRFPRTDTNACIHSLVLAVHSTACARRSASSTRLEYLLYTTYPVAKLKSAHFNSPLHTRKQAGNTLFQVCVKPMTPTRLPPLVCRSWNLDSKFYNAPPLPILSLALAKIEQNIRGDQSRASHLHADANPTPPWTQASPSFSTCIPSHPAAHAPCPVGSGWGFVLNIAHNSLHVSRFFFFLY